MELNKPYVEFHDSMKLIKPYVEFLDNVDRNSILQKIEKAGRTCYKSEANITPESASKFVTNLVKNNHWAMIEHGGSISIKFVTDRGVSHELVRHRIASFAQESTRYCTYGTNAKKPNEMTFIIPSKLYDKIPEGTYEDAAVGLYINDIEACNLSSDVSNWIGTLFNAVISYNTLIANAWTAQEARSILPNCIKTEIIMTANLREWRHFTDLRSKGTTGAPHPDMKVVADMVFEKFHEQLPEIFN